MCHGRYIIQVSFVWAQSDCDDLSSGTSAANRNNGNTGNNGLIPWFTRLSQSITALAGRPGATTVYSPSYNAANVNPNTVTPTVVLGPDAFAAERLARNNPTYQPKPSGNAGKDAEATVAVNTAPVVLPPPKVMLVKPSMPIALADTVTAVKAAAVPVKVAKAAVNLAAVPKPANKPVKPAAVPVKIASVPVKIVTAPVPPAAAPLIKAAIRIRPPIKRASALNGGAKANVARKPRPGKP